MKVCLMCKKRSPLTNFYTTAVKQYISSYCKNCSNRYRVQQLRKNRNNKSVTWVYHLLYNHLYGAKDNPVNRRKLAVQLHKRLLNTLVCPYTGDRLKPGDNIALDHKLPVSKRPDLALNLSNLQFVSKRYNQAKYDMTDRQFLNFCKLVVKRSDSRKRPY